MGNGDKEKKLRSERMLYRNMLYRQTDGRLSAHAEIILERYIEYVGISKQQTVSPESGAISPNSIELSRLVSFD